MIGLPLLTRRALLAAGGSALLVPLTRLDALAQLAADTPLHGVSPFGDLKYGPDFKHLDYVNPDAPKGGRLVPQSPSAAYNQNFNTFDTLNMFVLRGNGPFGMSLTFSSLLASSSDELGAAYAFVAQSVRMSADRLTWTFDIDPEAIAKCMQYAMPIMVFNFKKQGNIEKAVRGERVGTLVAPNKPEA
mgnify:CR=1 FL=1